VLVYSFHPRLVSLRRRNLGCPEPHNAISKTTHTQVNMAKIAKLKKREPSLHSRAARRAGSPSLNIDKSLKTATAPASNPHVHIFSAQNAGIRKKKQKPLKRGQRVRHLKGLERADIVKEQLDSKLKKSLGKLKTIKERRKEWEDMNEKFILSGEVRPVSSSKFDILDGEMAENEPSGVEMEAESMAIESSILPKTGEVLELPHRLPADIPLPPEEEDEIL